MDSASVARMYKLFKGRCHSRILKYSGQADAAANTRLLCVYDDLGFSFPERICVFFFYQCHCSAAKQSTFEKHLAWCRHTHFDDEECTHVAKKYIYMKAMPGRLPDSLVECSIKFQIRCCIKT